jgi:hypothetical protein
MQFANYHLQLSMIIDTGTGSLQTRFLANDNKGAEETRTYEDYRRLALELAERRLELGLELLVPDCIGRHGHLPDELLQPGAV